MSDGGIDLRIWGKEKGLPRPYPLAWHLADTAAVARLLWTQYLTVGARRTIAAALRTSVEEAGALIVFWAALHDIGKAIPCFQAQCPHLYESLRADERFPTPIMPQDMRHEEAAHRVLMRMFAEQGYGVGKSDAPAYRVAQLLGGHHGRFRSEPRQKLKEPLAHFPGLGADGWQKQRSALFEAMYETTGRPVPPTRVSGAAAAMTTGILILADWLASQESFLLERIASLGDTHRAVAERFHATYRVAPGLLDAAGLRPVGLRDAGFAESFGFEPNALQHSLLEELPEHVTGPGILLISAATGDGKTEAGLSAARLLGEASGTPGLFFALPTMATADEMYGRVIRYVRCLVKTPTPVALLHSMAWLRDAFESEDQPDGSEVLSADEATMVAAPQWLSGAKRGLLAPVAVGTIDQALMGVLQLKHNVLRLLGLSGKVFVVDECHAYDPYMQGLLRRLLTWLGELRCPVVLMSATVPASIARSLVAAYVSGTSASPRPDAYVLDYPGWLYVSADTGAPTQVSASARAKIAAHRTATLAVDLVPVRHGPESVSPDGRLTALRAVLEPIVSEGGCAAVVCNTVADAQATYAALRSWLDRPEGIVPVLDLLHSRFTAADRARRTKEIVGRYGKTGTRPTSGGITVATQVIEQSLDLDFDLVISDLAPLAQLLQRAGRGHRHERADRPAWVKDPRLVVLVPVNAHGALRRPPHWGTVYPEFLLASTHRTLDERRSKAIEIPGDVSELMERVYNPPTARPGESFTEDSALAEHWIDYEGETLAQQGLAELVAVPPPADVRELSALSRDDLTETQATTRMGADSVRALVVHRDVSGARFLDPDHESPLPESGNGVDGRFTRVDIAELLAETIPVPENWVRDRAADNQPPERWETSPWLRELVLLPHDPDDTGALIGGRYLRLDVEVGLIRE
ncbi:CRISPR-associated helicase Cas3' [Actinomadura sp. DC4]|uniref:CRISPR-associated helicase Cas3' n=1 Tax=Actinomadura sp. DC4 TaxID=3055069 RepID=UPI0025B20AB5|nr:CRISPR-associated helicase Cas3' [Actinomadura sp. DC4]MDN3355835.1 CRISPR-associated helicase Cas3' [Actinomadura sp. DC4]